MEMNGGEAVVESLIKGGLKHVFGIVGSSALEVFDLLSRTPLQYIGVRHEQVAGHMADAYARVARRPAVCLVQNGAGLTNLVTAVATAFRARSPLLVISGSPTSRQLFTDTYQEIDHVGVMRSVTKWSHLVNRADRIAEALQHALRVALTPPYGPTFVDIPRDYLYELADVDIREPSRFMADPSGPPRGEDVERTLELIRAAHAPVILAGGGVAWSDASEAVEALAAALHAPICTTYGHNDAVSSESPWCLGSLGRGGSKAAMKAFGQADLILALGTRMDPFSFLPYYGEAYFPPEAKIVQVNNNPLDIGRQYAVTIGVVADVKRFVQALAPAAGSPGASRFTLQQVEAWRREWRDELAAVAAEHLSPLSMEAAYAALARALPSDAIRTVDIGSSPSFAYSMLSYTAPRCLVPPLGLGGVGFALPASLGAKVASPDRDVVALMGDGALSMSIPALFTAVEHRIHPVVVVFDNGAWGAEKANQQYFYDANYVGTNLETPDLTQVAAAIGASARTVDRPDDVTEALLDALRARDRVHVLRIPVDPERFPLPARRDALKKPLRRIYT